MLLLLLHLFLPVLRQFLKEKIPAQLSKVDQTGSHTKAFTYKTNDSAFSTPEMYFLAASNKVHSQVEYLLWQAGEMLVVVWLCGGGVKHWYVA